MTVRLSPTMRDGLQQVARGHRPKRRDTLTALIRRGYVEIVPDKTYGGQVRRLTKDGRAAMVKIEAERP